MYHNRTRLSEELEAGAKYCSFDELLAKSDVISLNLSLNANTRHIIAEPEFQKMKDGVVIVNTARGALIDEAALVDALKSGKVWTVGLDVFEEEPKIHPGLLECENAVLLPHVGTGTVETQVSCNSRRRKSKAPLTHIARHGTVGVEQLEVGNQGRETVDSGA
jgi:glyoxylate reductase